MNTGALRLIGDFFTQAEASHLIATAQDRGWTAVWEDGSYADEKWRKIQLLSDYQETENYAVFGHIEKVRSFFRTEIVNMMFYSMLPGSVIKPHRDMIGNVGWGGLRFHIPLQTNPDVHFMVSGERVVMNVGELWALDTSYLHSVRNDGSCERIHLVFDVRVNDWVKSELLPRRNVDYYLHQGHLMALYIAKVAAVSLNPVEFRNNYRMAKRALSNLVFRR